MKRIWLLLLFGSLLMACTTQNDSATPTDEVMLRDGYFPKVLVTVELSPTPNPAQAAAPTVTLDIQATIDDLAPTATPSQTPTTYVGVFLGEPTSVGPEGEFIIPPTLVPLMGQPADGSSINAQGNVPQITILSTTTGGCNIPSASVFATAYASNPSLQAFGCPLDAGGEISLVTQRFEHGRMIWRDTRQIIILGDSGTFWRATDNWRDGMPADDPLLIPPSGMSQPVRGFGLVWRENEVYRTSLGWALGPEFPVTGFWQEFQGGTLLLGDGNQIYAIPAGGTGQYFRG